MNDLKGDFDAAQALAAMDQARAALLERASWGSWRYDLIYSVLVVFGVMAQAFPLPVPLAGDALMVAGLVMLARWWRARTGVWINGCTPQRARWVAVGIGLMTGAASLAALIGARQGQGWIAFGLGPVAGLLALAGSRLWRRVYREEVEAGVVADPAGRRRWTWLTVGAGAACGLLGAVLALRGVDSYIVGLFVGVAMPLVASPWLFALKRRFMFR